jgi:hypothetical protein
MVNSGYTLSPGVDLLAGLAFLSNEYSAETNSGKPFGMNSLIYGFDIGVRFYIPGRIRDESVFRKAGKE